MSERLRTLVSVAVSRLRRVERREVREFRLWIEHTGNLLRLTVLVVVPLLIALVTYLSNALRLVSFLIFPPLASGTYTLFANPEGRYSSPGTFVGGMTLGALSGWVAVEVVSVWRPVPPGIFRVTATGAALAILLTGLLTWALDLEEPTAFSTALLVLLIGGQRLEYVVGVALSSVLVATVFVVWRDRFYERRARYLYRSTTADDRVLVPMRGRSAPGPGPAGEPSGPGGTADPEGPAATALFGARLAAAHDAGKVVLLDVVDDRATARAERAVLAEAGRYRGPPDRDPGEPVASADEWTAPDDAGPGDAGSSGGSDAALESAAEERAVAASALELEALAADLEREAGVPCEVVVGVAEGEGWTPGLVTRTAADVGCDLVVTPYEAEDGGLSWFVRGLFRADIDVIAFRSDDGRRSWNRAMVLTRRAGAVAHAMIDFAGRLTGPDGRTSVCHCIASELQRRSAEAMLADLLDAFEGGFETRVANAPVEEFVATNAPAYDVVFVGASTGRTAASRLLSPPTFRRLAGVDTDVAIVHRGR